ncbi:hypothetical protein SEPCBS57363_000466 [Sporothrix epigloea]|uniref:UBC core domain-containing protein n=1 Tax=Sporothrix epigloea TaxID=1892477 RepID=A0ABP0D821_9PEZI
MPRRAYVADVELLTSQAAEGKHAHIKNVAFDSANDVITLILEYTGLTEPGVLEISCGDIDVYPNSKMYFLSLEHAPCGYDQVLDKIQELASPKSLFGLISQVDEALVRLQEQSCAGNLPCEDAEIIIHSSDSECRDIVVMSKQDIRTWGSSILPQSRKRGLPLVDVSHYEAEDFILDYSSGDDLHSPQLFAGPASKTSRTHSKGTSGLDRVDTIYNSYKTPISTQARIGEDLKEVCRHGYHFGVLAGMSETSTENLLAVSVRTADLGLPPETLMAWDLDPDVFIVLLIHLKSRYIPYETLLNTTRSSIDLSFRIGKCAKYKPSVKDAFAFFGSTSSLDSSAKSGNIDGGFQLTKILVSTSLANFMNDYFLLLARYREDFSCSWAEAINDVLKSNTASANKYSRQDQSITIRPPQSRQESFPLLAMQFAMDQLKNCTHYCQACHSRLDKNHRSLKPTVCSRDLCLYQHISLGMGRSVEYEILCQSNVVDLLINFCYTALRASNSAATDPIRSYPTNLLLKVPDWHNGLKGTYSNYLSTGPSFKISTSQSIGSSRVSHFLPGQWVVVYIGALASHPKAHTFIDDKTPRPLSNAPPQGARPVLTDHYTDQIRFRHAVISSVNHANSTICLRHFDTTYTAVGNVSAEIFRYTKDFDELLQRQKSAHLLFVLDSLPPVQHLKTELEKPMVNVLKSASGVSPAAAVLLGWIVATNRSCILQIDEPSLMVQERQTAESTAPPGNYLQFCLLQGVPEHDYEFQRQLEIETMSDKSHTTLLAWHGSKSCNWHSILRTGLDYKTILNGRAFGDGVYFSPDFSISSSYTAKIEVQWPKATVDLRSVVSLNELVNAPHKFKSSTPHYVIDQKYWSRCRYLFAKQERSQDLWSSPNQAIPLPQPMQQTSQSSVLNIGGQQMRATTTSVPRPHPLQRSYRPMSPAPTPTPTHTRISASQRAVGRGSTGPNRYIAQVPGKCAIGPNGNQIEVPLVMMPASHGVKGSNEQYKQQPKVTLDRSIKVMDASDKAFLPTNTTKKTTASPLSGTTVATAIVIDLDSDSSSDTPLHKVAPVAVRPRPASSSLDKNKTLSPLPMPRSVRKTLPVASSSNAARSVVNRTSSDSGLTPFNPGNLDYTSLPQLPLPSWCTPHAQRALSREIGRMQKVQNNTPLSELGWYMDFSRLDNMFQWIVELHSFDLSLPMAKDMMALGLASIVCELRFGADYPMSPPLVRVIRPRFMPFLQGGGGNVTAGGAMCMELLTSTGWTPANQTDAVLLQVRLALCATDRPARLDKTNFRSDYGEGEAFAAYERAAAVHGWTVPRDMRTRMNF